MLSTGGYATPVPIPRPLHATGAVVPSGRPMEGGGVNPGRWALAAVMALGVVGCSEDEPTAEPDTGRSASPTASPESSSAPPSGPVQTREPVETETTPVAPDPPRCDKDAALRTIRRLAGLIGPREAATPDFERAAEWVTDRFTRLGYDVDRERVRVPAGVSWGIPVDAGHTWNIIAPTADLQPGDPYRIVGAHLDTVPQAPGAEDNASGISVLLGTAQLYQHRTPKLPTVFVAFGAEEPRGDGDNRHHYGSRTYVASLPTAQRGALRGM